MWQRSGENYFWLWHWGRMSYSCIVTRCSLPGNTQCCWTASQSVASDSFLFVSLYTHTHPFNGPISRTTRLSRYQKGNTNLDFCEARDSEWQWRQLGHMQVCTSLQTDNHASTPQLSFLQAGCPSCHPTNSVKALRAESTEGCSCPLFLKCCMCLAQLNQNCRQCADVWVTLILFVG